MAPRKTVCVCPAAAFAACCLCLAAPARAADCVLVQLNAMAMTQEFGGERLTVPVVLNGVAKTLVLGTAGGLTSLNQATVEAMNLHPRDTDGRLLDSAGNASRRLVHLDTLQLGTMHARNVNLMITPDVRAGVDPPSDGILAGDWLSRYDVEMDFANRKLNYFSPEHCPGKVVYWRADMVGAVPILMHTREDNRARLALAAQAMPVVTGTDPYSTGFAGGVEETSEVDPNNQKTGPHVVGTDIQIEVTLDGKRLTANIDTALEYSTLNTDAAKALFDVTADSPGSAPAGSLIVGGGPVVSETVTVYGSHAFAHTFHTLSFGGVTVTDPPFLVRPDATGAHDPDNEFLAGSHVWRLDDHVEPDLSIGMDVLGKLHLFFAFRGGKLYVTPAAPKSASAG